MPRFFVGDVSGDCLAVTGQDAKHITKVLRMAPGETLTLCDGMGTDALCEIIRTGDEVALRVLSRAPSASEPSLQVTLFQALPKADKMELIVQKSVELGVYAIVPVLTARCVSRPDQKSLDKKIERWNQIALEAAKQSGRGLVPRVHPALGFGEALGRLRQLEHALLLYERLGGSEHRTLKEALPPALTELGLFIGPEGGFADEEAVAAEQAGVIPAGLGPRILRTETAPLCALSALMFYTGNI